MKKLILLGASGVAHEMIDTAHDINCHKKRWDEIVILDDDHKKVSNEFYRGTKVYGTSQDIGSFDFTSSEFIVTFSSPQNFLRRENYINQLKTNYPDMKFGTLIHPSAYISNGATIGEGSFIGYSAFVDSLCRVGEHVIVLFYSIVSRFVEVGDYSFISASVNIIGNKKIGKSNYLGAKSTINANIGSGCLIGTGTIVKKDIPDNSMVTSMIKNDILTSESPLKMQKKLANII